MHIPEHFQETRPDILHALIRQRAMGTLVTLGPAGIEANHLPFVFNAAQGPHGTLQCHVARANPVWREAGADPQALVIFQGPDAYVSPSWYLSKRDTHRAVPTWNYVVVHAYGRPRVIQDPAWLRAHLEQLTRRHESGREAPWRMSDAPADFLERMINAVVGIEIPVSRLLGKRKLSQNRPAADQAGVIEGLSREGTESAQRVADLMGE
jgi:transcriptional regulator